MLLDSGHEATQLQGEELARQERDFTGYKNGLVRLTPGRWLFPARFTELGNKIYNFKWRSSDVVLMTYPKCGTTWMQEILWTMRYNPDLDQPTDDDPITNRVPFFESDMFIPSDMPHEKQMKVCPRFLRLCPGADANDGMFLQLTEVVPDPRTIKTHLPFSLFHPSLLDTAKVVVVARNPKDALLSYCHHSRLFFDHGFTGSLEEFYRYFTESDLVYGSYDVFLKEACERRSHPNLHFVFYEDMKADIMRELRRLNSFIGTQLTEDQLKKVAHYTSFSEMKSREAKMSMKDFYDKDVFESDGGFFRKGESGDWKKSLPPSLIAKMDSWMKQSFSFITFH